MNYLALISFILLFNVNLYAINIDENSSNLSILNQASIFIDKSNNLSLDEIKKQDFTKNNKINVNLGYRANRTLWIKFLLHNRTNKPLRKILEFDNKETENVIIYEGKNIFKGGTFHYNINHENLTPTFILNLDKNESKIYYVKTTAKIKTLKAKITLWNEIDFVKYDLIDKAYRFIFLGMILVLLIYNTFVLFFTKDKAYRYYVLYLLSLIIYTSYYSNIISYYLLSQKLAILAIKFHTIISIVFIAFCILFTQEFLKTKQFKKLHKALNISLYSLPIIAVISYDNWLFNSHLATSLLLIGILIVYTGFYALYKGVQEAKYYVLGWSIILISISLFGFQTLGFYNLKDYHLSYLVEISFILEALLFSIALSHRIKLTNEAKVLVDAKLIAFQEEEKEKLNILVSEKTNELKHSLNEKEILYKELNHRVKNNFMMILSLLKLQISRSNLTETKDSLKITKNRIESIANLYEMLLLQNEDLNIDPKQYLKKIYNNISLNFKKDVTIEYNIQYNISIDSLIYVGLVFNELITNSFKYAFPDNKGKIFLTLKKEAETIVLMIKDDGQGFKEKRKNSLGLTIVETLIEGQLGGELTIHSDKGTETIMHWLETKT